MIGTAVAGAVELLLPGPEETGLFGTFAQTDLAGQLAAAGILLLCCSGGTC